jgi:hypothetical protein
MISAIPGQVFPFRQRLQQRRADPHLVGRIERPDQVLDAAEIDAGFSACGGIHHGQQRGGHENQPAAPHIQRGGKRGDVGENTSADSHHQLVPAHG